MKVFEDTEDADEAEAIKAVEKPSLFDLRVTSGVQVSELSYLQSALPLSVVGHSESSPKYIKNVD